jgi:tetratricopeptide (TPR) repeat protein
MIDSNVLLVDDVPGAIALLEELEKEQNVVIAVRMILRKILRMKESEGSSETRFVPLLKQLVPYINGVKNERYRALLLGELAMGFYTIGAELEGDFALKASINLSLEHPDVLRDIIMGLINAGFFPKAGYAMKFVKDKEKLDVVLVHLAEVLYERGEVEKTLAVIGHITSNFHRAVALLHLAQFEKDRDKEKALQFIDWAIKLAERIDDPDARFELMLKLYDLKHEIRGEPLSLFELLMGGTPGELLGIKDRGKTKGPRQEEGIRDFDSNFHKLFSSFGNFSRFSLEDYLPPI